MPPTESDGSAASRPGITRPASGRREVLAGAASLAALGTAGCLNVLDSSGGSSATVSDGWHTYRGDHRRTGRAPADAGPGDSLSIAWETSVVDLLEHREDVTARRWHEVSRGDRVVAGRIGDVTLTDDLALCTAMYRHWQGGSDGSTYWGGTVALDAASGSIEWTIAGTATRFLAPTLEDGRLYQSVRFPVDDVDGAHVLIADAATGEVEARHPVTGDLWGGPTVTAQGIYQGVVNAADGPLVRIDPASGEREWIVDVPTPKARVQPYTVTDGSIVYGATEDERTHMLVALDPETGEEQWRQSLGQPPLPSGVGMEFLGAPSIVDGRAFVAGRLGEYESGVAGGTALHSISLDDRSDHWSFRPETVPVEELRVRNYQNCIIAEGCTLPDGYSALRGRPLVLDDLVVVPGIGQSAPTGLASGRFRHLYAVSTEDGSLQWSIPGTATSAVAAGDVIYARMVGNRQVGVGLVAISKDGSILDRVASDAGISRSRAPSIGHGRVYTTWGPSSVNVPGPDTVAAIE